MAKQHTFEIEDQEITLERPRFSRMGQMAAVVEKLYNMPDPGAILQHESFLGVLERAAATPEDFERLQELSFNGLWELWEGYLDFGGYEEFFTKASERQQRRLEAIQERKAKAGVAQLAKMKELGLLDADFSLADAAKLMGAARAAGLATPSAPGETTPSPEDDPPTSS